MVNGRNKGAAAEREFINILQPVVDSVFVAEAFKLQRNLEQTRSGGCDIVGAPKEYDFFSFEVKRCERLALGQWWEQTLRQCRKDQIPALAYRQSRFPWMVKTKIPLLGYFIDATISLEDFLKFYEAVLKKGRNS